MTQYTYYTVAALGIRVPNAVKRTLTTLQITQFLVGSTFAALHLFVSYTVPVTVAHKVAEKVVSSATPSSVSSVVSSVVSSATSSVAAALPTASGAALAFFRKLVYRAAGDEGLAENIAVPGQPLPYYQQQLLQQQQQQQQVAATPRPEHPIEQFFHKTVDRVVYRTEYQSVPCIDTSGQAFAVYLNLIYLAPLTFLFMRFFFKSYLRSRSPNDKGKPKRGSFSKATRDASEEVKRELESLDRAAENGISSAVHKSKDALRGRKTNANGIIKDERHGSLSPANKKFVEDVLRRSTQQLEEGAEVTKKNAKGVAKNVATKAQETLEKLEKSTRESVEQTSKFEEKYEEFQSASKKDKKSKLPQKKKERKETEESGVLVKKEDAEEDVQKPEKEPEPKDVNNTLNKSEGKGLF